MKKFLIRKLKYKNIRNQNILLVEKLNQYELKMENFNKELIKINEVNNKNKNLNDLIMKLDNDLKNSNEKN